jgi:hypothetical protein
MTRPGAELRRQIIEMARNCCEYCRIPQSLALATHQVDHVIAEKHAGETSLSNLALSCAICNRRKGSDISSLDPDTGKITGLFHPREMDWAEHFVLEDLELVGQSPEARTTIAYLKLNNPDRIAERKLMIFNGWNMLDSAD